MMIPPAAAFALTHGTIAVALPGQLASYTRGANLSTRIYLTLAMCNLEFDEPVQLQNLGVVSLDRLSCLLLFRRSPAAAVSCGRPRTSQASSAYEPGSVGHVPRELLFDSLG